MFKKIHSRSQNILFKGSRQDKHYLIQLLILTLLIAFPFFSSILPFSDQLNGLLAITFIIYGLLLAERPRILMLTSGVGAILVILIDFSVISLTTQTLPTWILIPEVKLIIVIIYFILLGLHLLRDTLNQEVSIRLLYISMQNYLLIGLIFNYIYQLVQLFDAGAFNFPASAGYNYAYLSFITLTSVGFGDMLPVSNAAKSAVIVEAAAGQFYLTFFVALIIGKYLSVKSN